MNSGSLCKIRSGALVRQAHHSREFGEAVIGDGGEKFTLSEVEGIPITRSNLFANLSEVRSFCEMSDPLTMYTLYILQSLKDKRTYVGSTDNLERRLKQHNSGQVKSTKHRTPFKLLFTEEFATSKEAKKRELYYKSGAGRRKLKEFFKSRI